ncbi:MAG: imidazole glycerol phosphate synthase subunit HisF [Ilumatobacter sp.]|nr:imidazole glycerol phosphate synthase subunit HisF [Ilumatobacter sp.]
MRFRPRVIPVLLLSDGGLVKSTGFTDPRYLGDPINIVRIFNEKGVDELVLLDIDAGRLRTPADIELLAEIASEAFVPLAVGGGIETVDEIRTLLGLGFEKVVLCSVTVERPEFVAHAAATFATSSIVVCIDVKRGRFGRREVMTRGGQVRHKLDPVEHAINVARLGAGEIIVQSVDRDGSMAGYDLELVEDIADAVDVPVIALGGAGSVDDFDAALRRGAAAAAAGSTFVFQGRHRAVLVTYPTDDELGGLTHAN